MTPPPSPSPMGRTEPSMAVRKFRVVLRDARKLLPSLAPAVIVPCVICSGGDLILPGSNLSLLIIFCLFCCIAAYSSEPIPVAKSFLYLTYGALFAFFAARVLSDLIGLLILYLVCMLAAFLLGVAVAPESNRNRKRRSPVSQHLPLLIVRTVHNTLTVRNTLTLEQVAGCLLFATLSVFILASLIPKSDIVAVPVLFLCLILYSTFLGYLHLGLKIINTLSRLRVESYYLFLAYRTELHATFDPEYKKKLEESVMVWFAEWHHGPPSTSAPLPSTSVPRPSTSDLVQQGLLSVTVGGDRRSLLCLSFVLAVTDMILLWLSRGQPVLPPVIFSLIITAHLFCGILYYSTKDTELSKIFIFLSYTWLVGFSAGDVWGMIIMYLDSILAAGLFGATLAQHRQRKDIETAADVAFQNAFDNAYKKQNRRPAYYMIGFLALCYVPRLVWLILMGRPALDVAVSFFGAIGFLQVIHLSCIVGWLNGAIFDSSVPIFIYFASVAWIFVSAYLVFGEVVSLTVLWHCILASTSFLGYYSQVHASYEKLLNSSSAEDDVAETSGAPRSPVLT